jgi:putative endonuclease
MDDRVTLGRNGESIAADFLAARGYSLIARNHRSRYGELDLVTCKDGVTVFVEIKTRRSKRLGWPEQGISRRKREHLIAAAQAYLVEHPELGGDWRVDVIAIEIDRATSAPTIVHFEHAFQ